MTRATLIYSGGSDSFTLLHYLRAGLLEVDAVSFNYGQRHGKELDYASRECARHHIVHTIIDLPFMRDLARKSALTSKTPVPEGFYADDNMKQTVVPNRNMIMLSIAAAYALNNECSVLAYGAHQGDHDIYPDCRGEFIEAMHEAFRLCDWSALTLVVPFASMDKRAIYKWGLEHNLDYANAWTCYNGRERACGKCGSCVERLHAFHDIGAEDPMRYEDRDFWRTTIPGDKAYRV